MKDESEKIYCASKLEVHHVAYAVSDEASSCPYAVFTCLHCAKEYMDTHVLYKPFIHELPFNVYAEFFRNIRQGVGVAPGV